MYERGSEALGSPRRSPNRPNTDSRFCRTRNCPSETMQSSLVLHVGSPSESETGTRVASRSTPAGQRGQPFMQRRIPLSHPWTSDPSLPASCAMSGGLGLLRRAAPVNRSTSGQSGATRAPGRRPRPFIRYLCELIDVSDKLHGYGALCTKTPMRHPRAGTMQIQIHEVPAGRVILCLREPNAAPFHWCMPKRRVLCCEGACR